MKVEFGFGQLDPAHGVVDGPHLVETADIVDAQRHDSDLRPDDHANLKHVRPDDAAKAAQSRVNDAEPAARQDGRVDGDGRDGANGDRRSVQHHAQIHDDLDGVQTAAEKPQRAGTKSSFQQLVHAVEIQRVEHRQTKQSGEYAT